MQFTRNIGDRRLLEPDFPEQAFRDLDNQLMSVLFFGFSFSPPILPNISATMDVARALRFLLEYSLAIICSKSLNRCAILSLLAPPALSGSTLNLQVRIVS